MPVTTLITRPEPAAGQLAERLRDALGRDMSVICSPVMVIEPVERTIDLDGIRCLIFTSQNGLNAFMGLSERRDIPCVVIGDQTAENAQLGGLRVTYAARDADTLVAELTRRSLPGPCLHLRGQHTTGAIAERLSEAGTTTLEAVIYRQTEKALSEKANRVLCGNSPVILPFYSPRSARLLFSQVRPTADLLVVAISGKVAEAVPAERVCQISIAERPDGDAMFQAILAMSDAAKALEGAYRAK